MNAPRPLVNFALNIALAAAGALLFALGFPNFIADWGLAPFAWIALIPPVILIRRVPWWSSPLWGAFYGYITYALFNFWLATFNPVSFVLVPAIYAGWFFMLFPLLSLADRAFPRFGRLAQLLIWCAFEVVRTKGFIGYSYGVIGYSQYSRLNLIAIADIFGVTGVSLLVACPSFLIADWLLDAGFMGPGAGGGLGGGGGFFGGVTSGGRPFRLFSALGVRGASRAEGPRRFLSRSASASGAPGSTRAALTPSAKGPRFRIISGLTWAAAMLLANIYGAASRVNYQNSPRWKPALIQHNVNTWLTGIDAWRTALDALIEETDIALEKGPDAVIWSETAFVPSIQWHLKYRRDRSRVNLVNTLRRRLAAEEVPFLIGNNDAVMEAGRRQDYNAVLLLEGGRIARTHRKIHLVPFSEHFPYADTFPRLMNYIESQGTPLYGRGTEYTVFDLGKWNGPKAGPLICFEDTFGYLSRNFVNAGAEVLVNVTNDSWSPEPACAIQHLGMAVFRAVENRRSMVRATTAGLTAVIDPNGAITQKIDPFTQGHIIADVPVYTERTTFYTRRGDWFETLILIIASALLLSAGALTLPRLRSTQGPRAENANRRRG